jgi:hypothetical protein
VVSRNDEKELKEDEIELPQFIAFSNEPKTNDKTAVHKIARNKPITFRQGEEDIYMKYPFEKKYLLSLKSSYNKEREEYKSKLEVMIPKNGEDTVRYRDGDFQELVNQ